MRQVAAHNNEPLSQQVFLILLGLSDVPRHGYALIKEVERLSGGRVLLSTGTLYGALRRLLEDRWIERHPQDDTSRDKQAYLLTRIGRDQVEADLARIRQLARAATARLRVPGVS
jgi:DNA-binding PadR family transcriptional regulator